MHKRRQEYEEYLKHLEEKSIWDGNLERSVFVEIT